MRGLGLIGLLLALVAAGWLATRQTAAVLPASGLPAGQAATQGRQVQQQIQQQLDRLMQTPRDLPDDAK